MTTFAFDHASMNNFADRLGQLGDTTWSAKIYTTQWVLPAGGDTGQLFSDFTGVAVQVSDKVHGWLGNIYDLLSVADRELVGLGNYFQSVEDGNVDGIKSLASQDLGYTGYDSSLPTYSIASRFDNNDDPEVFLVEPADPNPIGDLASFIMSGAWALVSPSHWVLELIQYFNHGVNPLDDVLEKLCGDRNRPELGSMALTNLAAYHETLAEAVLAAKNTIMDTWEGNSAEAANTYFNELSRAIDDLVEPLTRISQDFHNQAIGMQTYAQTLGGLFEDLGNALIAAAVTLAATVFTSWTGIGDALGAMGLSAEGIIIVTTISSITTIMGHMFELVSGLVAIGDAFTATSTTVETMESVGKAPAYYDNPFVDVPVVHNHRGGHR